MYSRFSRKKKIKDRRSGDQQPKKKRGFLSTVGKHTAISGGLGTVGGALLVRNAVKKNNATLRSQGIGHSLANEKTFLKKGTQIGALGGGTIGVGTGVVGGTGAYAVGRALSKRKEKEEQRSRRKRRR